MAEGPDGAEDADVPTRGPLRVARLTAQPFHDRPYPPDASVDEGPIVQVELRAEFNRACPDDEWAWWKQELRRHVQLSGGMGSPTGLQQVHVRVPPDQVEDAARRLLDAFRVAATEYPHQFMAWKRQRDEERAAKKRREDAEVAPFQAILDRLMAEYG